MFVCFFCLFLFHLSFLSLHLSLRASSFNIKNILTFNINLHKRQVNTTYGISRNTPLHEAATNPHIDRFSSNKGALGSAKKKEYYAHKESLKIIQLLLKKDAKVNAKNTYENTPLHAVCIEGLEDCAKALLEAGADITQRTGSLTKSSTPLHLASEYSHPALVRFLLESGADIKALNSEGKTCLETAMETNVGLSEQHQRHTIDLLLEMTGDDAGVAATDEGIEGNLRGNANSMEDDGSSSTAAIDLEEQDQSGSTSSNQADDAPRLSEDLSGEAARLAAEKGRKAAAKKAKKKKKEQGKKTDDQPKGCGCTIN